MRVSNQKWSIDNFGMIFENWFGLLVSIDEKAHQGSHICIEAVQHEKTVFDVHMDAETDRLIQTTINYSGGRILNLLQQSPGIISSSSTEIGRYIYQK